MSPKTICWKNELSLAMLWLAVFCPVAIWGFSLTADPDGGGIPLDNEALAGVSGGAQGNCCNAGTPSGCNVGMSGCSQFPCTPNDANGNCGQAGQQVQKGLMLRYARCVCISATGSKACKNGTATPCFRTDTCTNPCVQYKKNWVCGANQGANGPNVQPTVPNAVACP